MWSILRVNEHLAHLMKQSVTTVNALLCLLLNIPLGLLYRKLLHPKRTPPVIRHLVGLVLGLWIGWVCIGREMYILITITSLCYVLNYFIKPRIVHKVIFFVSFGLLIVAQTIRMVQNYGENIFDYTGRLMMLIQKITYVAYCFHDGVARDPKDLNDWQRKQYLKKFPNPLEYFGYTFHFNSFLVGPTYTYREYIDFIEGKDIERALADFKGHNREPSPTNGLKTRLLIFIPCLIGTGLFSSKVPLARNGDPTFIANTPFLLRCLYAWVSIFVVRLKYYAAFLLGEMAVISCGVGFSGFDDNGNELWENASNINCYNVEFPTSLKMVTENWNIATSKWLRRVVHDRVPFQKAALTFTASVLWHGLYPGYFLIATSSFLYLEVSKEVRRQYGHVYQHLSPIGQKSLLTLQIFVNVVLLTYCTIPFPLLRFDLGIRYWTSLYFFGHIVCGLGLVLLRLRRKPKPKKEDPTALPQETHFRDSNTVFSKKEETNGFLANNNAAHLRKPHFNKGS